MRKITHLCARTSPSSERSSDQIDRVRSGLSPNQAPANSISNGGGSTRYVELHKNVAQVTINRPWADYQYLRHFTVGVTLRNEPQHFQLAPGKMEIKLIARV